MNRKYYVLVPVLALVLILSAFAVGRASATTGCFNDTNGHWAETFICWMNDNGITGGYPDGGYHPNSNVTRAEMAVFMKAQADVPPSTGDVYFTFGPNEWQPNAFYDGYIEYYSVWGNFSAATSGTKMFQATPVLPSSLYNTVMYIKGVQICYDATGGGYIDTVTLNHYKTWDDGSYTTINTVSDTTDRTDDMCRAYYFSIPMSFYGDNHLAILVFYHLNNPSDTLGISSTTVILEPSAHRYDHLTMPEPLAPSDMEPINPETGAPPQR
ncbi:MAG: S-layer homology domain-containing protein [Chloroflexota bacterium]